MNAIDLIEDYFKAPGTPADLRQLVGSFIRRRRWAEADDLIQQAVIEMVQRPDRVRAASHAELRERIRTNTQRRFVDDVRRRRRRREVPLAGVPDREGGSGVDNPHHERLAHLRRHIELLPDDHQDLIRLKYQERLSIEEIAARRRQSTRAVKQALIRIRQRLGEVLKSLPCFRPPSRN